MRLKLTSLVAVALLASFVACKKKENPQPEPQPQTETPGVISINGKEYKTLKIGSLTWTTESYAGPGGEVYGPVAKPAYGKYYTYNEVKAITLPTGWRVPTTEDYKNLGATVGIVFTAGAQNTEAAKKLISKTGWKNAMGNNSSGFNALPGNMIYNGEPAQDGNVAEFWTVTGQTFSMMEAGSNGLLINVQFFVNSDQPEYRFPVRFVKEG